MKTTTTPHTTVTTPKTLGGEARNHLAVWAKNSHRYAHRDHTKNTDTCAGWTGPHQED